MTESKAGGFFSNIENAISLMQKGKKIHPKAMVGLARVWQNHNISTMQVKYLTMDENYYITAHFQGDDCCRLTDEKESIISVLGNREWEIFDETIKYRLICPECREGHQFREEDRTEDEAVSFICPNTGNKIS